jgi:hypothetical protein
MGRRRTCARCGTQLQPQPSTGRPRLYCRLACRKAAYRARVSNPSKASRSEWWTPPELLASVRAHTDLGLDAAACADSTAVPAAWLGPTHASKPRRDALAWASWAELTPAGTTVWLNPPYAPALLRRFLARAVATSDAGTPVIALIPASTGAHWWHDFVLAPGADVEFLRGRVSYGGPHSTGTPAPWPSALVTYRPGSG